MSRAEFEDKSLPYLFGAPANPNSGRTHSRRTKTAESLFPHLKDTLYRCKEYPHGIYINSFGQLCPDDSRSGLYQIDETGEVEQVVASEEDDDNDNVPDEVDETLEKEEKEILNRKRKLEEEEEEEYDDDESDEWTVEQEDEDDEEDDEDDDYEEDEPRPSKKRKDDITDDEFDGDDEQKLTQQQRKEAYLKALEDGVKEQERMNKIMDEKKKQRIKDQKNLAILDEWTEEWKNLRNRAFRKRRALDRTAKNDTIIMTYDAHILTTTNPGCDFEFSKPGTDRKITAKFDCDTATIRCQDSEEQFSNMAKLYDYLESRFLQ